MLHLPRPWLSYSAIDLWLHSPAQFRKRYYLNEQPPVTPELTFGKHIATLLENADESVSHIKQYKNPEHKIDVYIAGVPIFGFIDSYDPDEKKILEYKTGRTPWTADRVKNHKQLDLYSAAIEEMYGSVNDEVELIWMETEKIKPKTIGLISHEDAHKIRLTGKVEVFPRTVTDEDREAMRQLVKRVAEEISEDYFQWKD